LSQRMMSTIVPVEHALKALAEDGFYCIHDSTIGERILEAEQNRVQFSASSEGGWNFYTHNVLQDQRIRAVLESSFERCSLGYYVRLAEDQDRIYQIRRGGLKPDILLVQVWSKGSRVVYYSRSHLETLSSYRAANRMWQIPLASLTRKGCEGIEVTFEDGGFSILDARLGFEMRHGSPITCVFAAKEQLKTWDKLVLPKAAELTAAKLEGGKIGVHFEAHDKNIASGGDTNDDT